ncbi:Tyrocidine synthase 3 [BD1-7 clade bacterium]|uniref:Tyrocidine synthase 3 n=1 Tax=BD1-7 clade bacterium TaxID=2029982 RepID=A0A5S9QXU5_9GAMM|nr:Tyrocidine synthase 3 [BD1-7 clade bacterium]
MTIVSLIAQLAEQDIRLWLEDGQLRYSAPEGAMTPDIIGQIRSQKDAIMRFLAQSDASGANSIDKLDYQTGDLLPVSAAQQRLWFLQQLEPQNTAYHIHAALKLTGQLHAELLSKACAEVAGRHEILRTAYQADTRNNGQVQQQVVPYHHRPIEVISSTEASLINDLDHERCRSFDLVAGDVFRVVLLRLADDQHVFCFTIHHIAADGWSLGIFVNELITCYEALQADMPAPLPVLERQYADYAAWLNTDAQQQAQTKQLEYWQSTLQGVPNLALPLDHARSLEQGNEARYVDAVIDPTTLDALQALAKSHDATLFMVLMTAYASLLKRYCQQNDFCIGTPIAGRNAQQLEPLIGCFVNVLAMRFELDDASTFAEALAQHKAQSTAAFAHQDVPFEQIVNTLVKTRDLTITPLFQTMLSLQSAEFANTRELSNFSISPIEQNSAAAQFDLKLTANEINKGMSLRFEYKTALFNAATVEQMALHFSALLKAIIANPEQRIDDIALMQDTDVTAALALDTFNATTTELPPHRLIHQAIEQQAAKTPSAMAVSCDQYTLTYQALNQQANQLAHYLQQQGVTPNSAVGICLQRSSQMTVALLAVLKAGAAYVPMDPGFPAERLAFMTQELQQAAGMSVLLTDKLNAASITAAGIATQPGLQICLLDQLELETLTTDNLALAHPQANDSLFNIIYTSGSTGTPKGVMVPHEGIFNRLHWMQKTYPLTADDKVLQKTPYSFDVSVWEFFWPLMNGASCHFAQPEEHKDPQAIAHRIQQHGITTCHFVPSMLGAFLTHSDAAACNSLKQVFCSGEALQLDHESSFFHCLPKAKLHNLYGPTEASVDVSYYPCSTHNNRASVPIGKPVDNIQLHILDKNLRPMPQGLAGELCIGGIGLAQGYLARETLTANAFVKNPYHSQGHPSERLYRTGDLVRQDDDGNLIYLGRIDHQVKIRGNRIELGDIEATIARCDGVREAVVCARGNGADQQLVGYLLTDTGADVDTVTVSHTLQQQLPAYMQPAALIVMDTWPLSPNGKINRNKLPDPDWQALNQTPFVAPTTDTEIRLADIWSEVLEIDQVGINDSFFALGGHSLTATAAIAKAQKAFGVEIPLKDIFQSPTINAIAAQIDNALVEQSVFTATEATDDDDDDLESFVL